LKAPDSPEAPAVSQMPAAAETPPAPPQPSAPKRRRRGAWLALLALLAVVAAGAYLLWPRPPTVSALLRVGPLEPGLLAGRALTDREVARFRRGQPALARSRNVLNKALANSDVAELPIVVAQGPDAAAWLEASVSVDFPEPDADLMRISMRGPTPTSWPCWWTPSPRPTNRRRK